MKKLICILGFCTLVLTSCSTSESTPSANENEVLVVSMVDTYANDGSTVTTNFTYNGKKMVRTTSSDGYYENYTYAGDLLTRVESFDTSNILLERYTYSYNSEGYVVSNVDLDFEFNDGFRETYVYNSDGTVSVTGYDGTLASQTDVTNTAIVSFANGEVSSYENTSIFFGETSSSTYVYDTQNNPFKNVIGFNKLKFVNFEAVRSGRNIITQSFDSPTINYVFSSVFTYNGLNFPTLQTTMQEGIPDATVTTQYSYN